MLGTYCFKIQILVYRIYEYNIVFMLKEPVKEKGSREKSTKSQSNSHDIPRFQVSEICSGKDSICTIG